MSTSILVGFLAFATLGSVAVFGYLSSVRTADRLHSERRKSTLAADAPDKAPRGEKPVDV